MINKMIKKMIPPIYRMKLGTVKQNIKTLFKSKVKVQFDRKVVIVIASPHKVGSTWIYKILRDLTAFHDLFPPFKVFNEFKKVKIPLDNLFNYFLGLKKGRGYLFKSHSMPPKSIDKGVFYITVIRDPRDLMVSMSHYVSHLPIELGGWGKEFSNKNDRDKIIEVIDKSDFIFDLYDAWANYDNCLLLKYEDLKKDIYKAVLEVVDYTGLNVTDIKIKKAIAKNDFKKVAGRRSGNEKENTFYRKGIVGDSKNYFDNELLEYLYTTQGGRWKDIIVKNKYDL
jgi:hypothetical protein